MSLQLAGFGARVCAPAYRVGWQRRAAAGVGRRCSHWRRESNAVRCGSGVWRFKICVNYSMLASRGFGEQRDERFRWARGFCCLGDVACADVERLHQGLWVRARHGGLSM